MFTETSNNSTLRYCYLIKRSTNLSLKTKETDSEEKATTRINKHEIDELYISKKHFKLLRGQRKQNIPSQKGRYHVSLGCNKKQVSPYKIIPL